MEFAGDALALWFGIARLSATGALLVFARLASPEILLQDLTNAHVTIFGTGAGFSEDQTLVR